MAAAVAGSAPGEKGLKTGALGFVSSTVIGVASTAPGYSLAAVLTLIVATAGVQAPAVLLVAFVPVLFIAVAYYHLNRDEPDCGTTFSWVTRAMGPWAGWMGGWAIIVADVIVMANLAQIAGLYSFQLVGWDSAADSVAAVTAAGVLWIALMTVICVLGIELSARTQVVLLGAEILTLGLFAVVALVKVYAGDAPVGSVEPALSWFNPLEISSLDALTAGLLIAIFIYWGWDSTVTVNEETENATETPGRAAVAATALLVLIYLVVAAAAIAFAGPGRLVADESGDALGLLGTDVLGSGLDKLVVVAVLTSAAASTQTTILPTSRTALSMARARALPGALGDVHPRYLTPHVATILFGVLSVAWYVGLTAVSENLLYDSILALGLMIAFYYALTGFACVVYFRRELRRSARAFLMMGVVPFAGAAILGYVFVRSCIDLSRPANATAGGAWLGVGAPLVIGIGALALGLALMALWYARGHREFFRRRPTVAPAGMLPG